MNSKRLITILVLVNLAIGSLSLAMNLTENARILQNGCIQPRGSVTKAKALKLVKNTGVLGAGVITGLAAYRVLPPAFLLARAYVTGTPSEPTANKIPTAEQLTITGGVSLALLYTLYNVGKYGYNELTPYTSKNN